MVDKSFKRAILNPKKTDAEVTKLVLAQEIASEADILETVDLLEEHRPVVVGCLMALHRLS